MNLLKPKIQNILRSLLFTAIIISSLIFNSASGQTAGPEIIVTLKPIVSVPDKKVVLDDIAVINCSDPETLKKLKRIAVCGYLLPLKPRLVTKEFVYSRIKQNQIHPSLYVVNGAKQVSINLKTAEVSEEKYRKAVQEYINSLPESDKSLLEIIQLPQKIVAPAKDLIVRVIPRKYGTYKGLLSLSVGIYNGNDLYKKLVARVKRKVFTQAVIAVKRINRQQVIKSGDITVLTTDVTGAGNNYCTDLSFVIGKRAVNIINENQIIQRKMIEADPIIKKGETVDLIVKKGNIEIKVKGKARMDGHMGDRIMVRNLLNNSVLKGIVKSSSLVLVR